ncbi:hypothetical protein HKD37_19G053790 [Glycine soja]
MFSNDEVGSQFSQLSIQIGLKDIAIEEIEGSSTKRKPQLAFAIEEDMHLISSWLNISIDPIIGVGQAKEAFWTKIYASGAYSLSSNPETLVEDSKADTPSPIVRLMGEKVAKRKSKGKGV